MDYSLAIDQNRTYLIFSLKTIIPALPAGRIFLLPTILHLLQRSLCLFHRLLTASLLFTFFKSSLYFIFYLIPFISFPIILCETLAFFSTVLFNITINSSFVYAALIEEIKPRRISFGFE